MKTFLSSIVYALGFLAFLAIRVHGQDGASLNVGPFPLGRVVHWPAVNPCDLVYTTVTRAQANPLLIFSDPNDAYPYHIFQTANGMQQVRVNDWTPLCGAPHVVYLSCTPQTAVPIVQAALAAAPVSVQPVQLVGTK